MPLRLHSLESLVCHWLTRRLLIRKHARLAVCAALRLGELRTEPRLATSVGRAQFTPAHAVQRCEGRTTTHPRVVMTAYGL